MKSALQGSSCTPQRRKALLAPAARKVWQLRVEVRAVQMSARRGRPEGMPWPQAKIYVHCQRIPLPPPSSVD